MSQPFIENRTRLVRRVAGHMATGIAALPLSRVTDPRCGKTKWKLPTLLKSVLVGLVAGATGLRDVEFLSSVLGDGARRLLGLPGRTPDTTLRDLLMQLNVHDLRRLNHGFMRAAERKKQVRHTLPLRVVSMDGKHTSSWLFDKPGAAIKFGQRQEGKAVVRTVTSCLASAVGRPCLDAFPIPPETNEAGIFKVAAGELLDAYPNRFDVIMYDSGACSLDNATWIRERGLDYVFCLTANQPTLHEEGVRCLGARREPDGPEVTSLEGSNVVVRRLFLHQVEGAGCDHGFLDWIHLRTIIRVEKTSFDKSLQTATTENHYYLTSLASDALKSTEWLEVIRSRWSVENQNHCTFDKFMHEDDRPWILDPAGMVNVMLLRRIAYNILAIFRAVTLRSESSRAMPWTLLIKSVDLALKVATIEILSGVRRRPQATL